MPPERDVTEGGDISFDGAQSQELDHVVRIVGSEDTMRCGAVAVLRFEIPAADDHNDIHRLHGVAIITGSGTRIPYSLAH